MSITEQPVASAISPEVADRLAQLASRRPAAVSSASEVKTPKAPQTRRRHPARKSRIAALVLSISATSGLAGAFAATDGPSNSVAVSAGGLVAVAAQASTAPTVVNGDVFMNKWGPVQVQATFSSAGELTAVDALQVPFVDGKSVRINDRAVPVLNDEALSTQSAQVDTVSGATYTSVDYEKSLQSALDAARSAGVTQLA